MARLVEMAVERASCRRLALDGITVLLPASASGSMTRVSASNALSAISVLASMSGRRWSAPTKSWASPPVKCKPIGLPRASTKVWILVRSPPRERPIAWSSSPFF